MRLIKRFLPIALLCGACAASAADCFIRNLVAEPLCPWGKVYLKYTIEGDASMTSEPSLFTAQMNVGDSAYNLKLLSGNARLAPGEHKVLCDAEYLGLNLENRKVSFSVIYRKLDTDYLVIDLTQRDAEGLFPLSGSDTVPAAGWRGEGNTTSQLVLRRVEAGTFSMQGTTATTISKPFYIGVYEFTQKQYELVMGTNLWKGATYGVGDYFPAWGVNYDQIRGASDGAQWPSVDAVDPESLLGKLRAATGLAFDLPTEAQWEYACRAGTTTVYPWGDTIDKTNCWYSGSGRATFAVGRKPANAWGIFDMNGNVMEWCRDWYGEPLAFGTDPKGAETGLSRVLRGGSYESLPEYCTSSARLFAYPSVSNRHNCGFRVLLTVSK